MAQVPNNNLCVCVLLVEKEFLAHLNLFNSLWWWWWPSSCSTKKVFFLQEKLNHTIIPCSSLFMVIRLLGGRCARADPSRRRFITPKKGIIEIWEWKKILKETTTHVAAYCWLELIFSSGLESLFYIIVQLKIISDQVIPHSRRPKPQVGQNFKHK